MTKHEGKTFENQTFVLEDNYFVNCVLRACDIFYSGGDYEWRDTLMDNCTLHFRGPAKNTQSLMLQTGMLKQGEKTLPPLKTSAGPVN